MNPKTKTFLVIKINLLILKLLPKTYAEKNYDRRTETL
ncbi:hypothetical protein LEP1GSC188_3958 [Leptospira weilii serovar Topaz str. LT2116]|uniref:Uncharacterized protein n=1 Tax=Leptospira weilii serovar Topaz str. LT2116 TaxID=1088540 RepID=M3EI93_9LEPT|nr:hypothetical protein LEP1GSC188_3958 [Leptospira weilii serovar Topaz str. LT2116]